MVTGAVRRVATSAPGPRRTSFPLVARTTPVPAAPPRTAPLAAPPPPPRIAPSAATAPAPMPALAVSAAGPAVAPPNGVPLFVAVAVSVAGGVPAHAVITHAIAITANIDLVTSILLVHTVRASA